MSHRNKRPGSSLTRVGSPRCGSDIYEVLYGNEGNVVLSNGARAPDTVLDADQCGFTGVQGYRMARATHGMYSGTYYYEATIEQPVDIPVGELDNYSAIDIPHYRIGFGRQHVCLYGPVGYDRMGFGIRDFDGTLLASRNRIKQPFPKPFGVGATLSFLIHIPECRQEVPEETEYIFKRYGEYSSKLLGSVYDPDERPVGESDTYVHNDEAGATISRRVGCKDVTVMGSYIRFFVDGAFAGSFINLPFDRYYPAVSVYGRGRVKLNFGPKNKIVSDCKYIHTTGIFDPKYLLTPKTAREFDFKYYPTQEHVKPDYIPPSLCVACKLPANQQEENCLRYSNIELPSDWTGGEPTPLLASNPYESLEELESVFKPFNELYKMRLIKDFDSILPKLGDDGELKPEYGGIEPPPSKEPPPVCSDVNTTTRTPKQGAALSRKESAASTSNTPNNRRKAGKPPLHADGKDTEKEDISM